MLEEQVLVSDKKYLCCVA